jgi:hypothetical protein
MGEFLLVNVHMHDIPPRDIHPLDATFISANYICKKLKSKVINSHAQQWYIMNITCVSNKYCVGLVSHTCGANLFLATFLQFRITSVLENHHEKIVSFITREKKYALALTLLLLK